MSTQVKGLSISLAETTTPVTPAAGQVEIYAKSDHRFYHVGSDGVEYKFAATSANGLLLPEGAAAGTPVAGQLSVYSKSDHLMYTKDSTGVERNISGGSSMVFISSQTVSAVASIDFTGLDNTYDQYVLLFSRVVNGSGDDKPFIRFSINNGSSYDATAANYWSQGRISKAGAAGADDGYPQNVSYCVTGYSSHSNANYGGMNGELRLYNMGHATRYPYFTAKMAGFYNTGNTSWNSDYGGMWAGAANANAVRIAYLTQNISGTVALYGIRKS